jgi:hypothetical protein
MAMTITTKTEKPLFTAYTPTTPAPSITRAVMLVTPALAAEWLKSNTRNRQIRKLVVETLATIIRKGEWHTTHQGIAFGTDGALYDGQHRLHAIVEAGIGVHVEVTRGLPMSAVDAIDTGGTIRRARDVVAITDGVRLTHTQSATYSVAIYLMDIGQVGASRLNPDRLRAAIRDHGAAATAIFSAVGTAGKTFRALPSPVTGSLVVAWHSEPKRACEFANMLRTGENLGPSHPALMLRNFCIDRTSSAGMAAQDALVARTFAAFDCFVRGDAMRLLKGNDTARARYVLAARRAVGAVTP